MISILVAVYNAERYIRTCLASLAQQTYTAFEVLCVDDASTDTSAEIIAEYASRDPRFRLIRLPENKGQAAARNVALRHSHGEIITMVDADDWLATDALQSISDTFARFPLADCVLFRCILVSPDGTEEEYHGDKVEVLTGREASLLSFTWRIHGCYAARRALYEQYPFDTTCHLYSDDNTTRVHYYTSREVRQSEGRYYYYQHALSATHRLTTERMLYMTAADSLCRQLEALGCDDEMRSIAETQRWRVVVDSYFYYYKHRRQFSREDRAYCRAAIKQGLRHTDLTRVDKALTRKFGYMPLFKRWHLFRAEEECYFFLRRLLRRN